MCIPILMASSFRYSYQGVQLRLVRKSGDRYSTKNRQEGSSKPGGLLEGGDARSIMLTYHNVSLLFTHAHMLNPS